MKFCETFLNFTYVIFRKISVHQLGLFFTKQDSFKLSDEVFYLVFLFKNKLIIIFYNYYKKTQS